MQISLKKVRPSHIMAQVVSSVQVTPLMQRITLGGFSMAAFLLQDGVDQPAAWVKVFPEGREGRAYTIRHIDPATRTIEIDFVLHGEQEDDGSVSAWARDVAIGDNVEIAGPRQGGFTLEADTEWVWLGADASALPAVQSILSSLPAGLDVYTAIEVHDAKECQPLTTSARLQTYWIYADAPAAQREETLFGVTKKVAELQGKGQVWTAGENVDVKNWRQFWLEDKAFPRTQLHIKGYWKRGEKDYKDRNVD